MAASPIEKTSKTLLAQIAQGSDSAWNRFFNTYKVLVYMRCRAWHLNDSDAEDLLIAVMQKFFDLQGHFQYNPAAGRFRDYFARMVRNAAVDLLRSRKRRPELPADDTTDELLNNLGKDTEADQASVRRDFQARIFAKALLKVKEKVSVKALQCWTAHWQNGVSVEEIARFNGLSLQAVYYNCQLVWKALKRLAAELEETEEQELLSE